VQSREGGEREEGAAAAAAIEVVSLQGQHRHVDCPLVAIV